MKCYSILICQCLFTSSSNILSCLLIKLLIMYMFLHCYFHFYLCMFDFVWLQTKLIFMEFKNKLIGTYETEYIWFLSFTSLEVQSYLLCRVCLSAYITWNIKHSMQDASIECIKTSYFAIESIANTCLHFWCLLYIVFCFSGLILFLSHWSDFENDFYHR